VEIAVRLGGEIVSADSVQVYKYLDIGTAKIAPWQQKGVPHHLLGSLEPDEEFTVAQFQQQARLIIEEISSRKKLPFLVGGTGLYIQAVIDPYEFPLQHGLKVVRKDLSESIEAGRAAELYAELQRIDPEAATRIHPNDHHRLIRALEVYRLTRQPITSFQVRKTATALRYELVMIGLDRNRAELYRRIDLRVEKMFRDGLIDEARDLLEQGFESSLKPLQTLGYRQAISYLEGKCDLDAAISLAKRATRNYAKRQLTWFRRDSRIHWFTLKDEDHPEVVYDEIMEHICKRLLLDR
jgi:tRNA dimethylallyltransferase